MKRIVYATPYRVGSLRLVRLRRQSGFAIADEAGCIVRTQAHPISGRPIPATEPNARQALRIAQDMQR